MGGGDLNLKKSWHPSTLRNIERVWKAEQKHEAEQKKIEQLQRELAEERAKEEMRHYAEDQGTIKKKEEKLDWMYSGPAALVDREQYLMGRQIDKSFELLQQQEQGIDFNDNQYDGSRAGSLFARGKSNAPVDIANKIREDPLFLIRKQEEEKQKKLLNNPVKLKQLQEMLRSSLSASKSKKKKHKRKHHDDSDDEDDPKHQNKRKNHKMSNHKEIKKEKPKYTRNTSESDSDSYHKKNRSSKYYEKYDKRDTQPRDRGNWYEFESSGLPKKKKTSKKELEKKRLEMIENAKWRDEQRKKNVNHYKEQEIKEEQELEKTRHKDFIKPMLCKAAETGTVEARIKQNIYNIQRNKDFMNSNFARR